MNTIALENINPKYLNLILYILERANDINLGKKKLFKLLYFIDFDFYEKHERSITGDNYVIKNYGPVPEMAQNALDAMEDAGFIQSTRGIRITYSQYRYIANKKADPDVFTGEELKHIDAVIERFGCYDAGTIEAVAKNDMPYRATKESGEKKIDYELVFYRNPSPEASEDEKEDAIVLNSKSLQKYLDKLVAA